MRVYQALKKAGKIRTKGQFEELASAGKITVNGKVIQSEHFFVKEKDIIKIENKEAKPKGKIEKVLILLHKPKGFSSHVKGGRYPSVMSLIDLPNNIKNTISPVGRLDVQTSGLLLLTNDGRLAHKILNDGTEKEYIASVKGQVMPEDIDMLRSGVQIQITTNRGEEPYITKPAKAKLLKSQRKESKFMLTIKEGKKRQVRLMCKKIDHPVLELKRVRVGEYKLGRIPLKKYEVIKLR